MEYIKNAHPYLKNVFFVHYVIGLVSIWLFYVFRIDVFLSLIVYSLIVLGVLYLIREKKREKELKYLISNVDAIIDQRSLDIIDGEGQISLLSHKIFILSKRYHSLIQALKQEQIELKDYIENISHQLKTPITSMRINEELLLETLDDEKQKEKIKQIHQQTLKINQLVNDLLTLALLDSRSVEMKFDHYPIELIVEDMKEDLEYLMNEKRMTIQLYHHQETILCDRKWMGEALKNIVKNCLEKNQDSSVDMTIEESESLVSIAIQDHGEGFLEEDIPHLFERFYRGKKKDYQGIGIGLALSKEVIEQHHGFMKVRNNNGALIEITIPKLLAKKKL